jgi:hypothetical protein
VTQHSKREVNWEFLLGSSKSTLQAYEQSRLNFAANLRKEIEQLLDTWVDENSSALLARWLIERNLAADVGAICTKPGCGPNSATEPQPRQTQVACGAPKPPSRVAQNAAPAAHNASDKIFSEKSYAPPRIHVAS